MDLWFYNSIDDLLSDEECLDAVAMSLFNALGHTCASTALLSDNDPMHFVYGALATKRFCLPPIELLCCKLRNLRYFLSSTGQYLIKPLVKKSTISPLSYLYQPEKEVQLQVHYKW